jgi:hypothetical protein
VYDCSRDYVHSQQEGGKFRGRTPDDVRGVVHCINPTYSIVQVKPSELDAYLLASRGFLRTQWVSSDKMLPNSSGFRAEGSNTTVRKFI